MVLLILIHVSVTQLENKNPSTHQCCFFGQMMGSGVYLRWAIQDNKKGGKKGATHCHGNGE